MNPCCTPTDPAATASYAALFVMGVTVSLGHCVGMCGPIQTIFSAEQARARRRPPWPWVGYHAGRVASYATLGALFGLAGALAVVPQDSAARVQAILSLVAGALLLVAGAAWITRRGWSGELPALAGVASRGVRRWLGARHPAAPVGLGVANGFLPCGPVLAAAVAAIPAAHAGTGALMMLAYGVGTVPVLLTLGLAAGKLGSRNQARLHAAAGWVMLLIAAQLVLRGLAALGWVDHVHLGRMVLW